jgi:hypothetical protein
MEFEADEYFLKKSFKFDDYTNKFKSFEEFSNFKQFIQENYKDYNDMIYHFDFNSSIPEIKQYYKDKIYILSMNNHYLILYLVKFNIIEKGAKLTPEILNNLVEMPSNDNIKGSWTDKNGKINKTKEIKRSLKPIIKKKMDFIN